MTSTDPLQGRSPWSVLPPLLTGFFMIMVDTTIVNIATPTLQREFGASLVEVGWVNSAYLLSFAVLLLVTGRLGDSYGPRRVYLAGLAVFTIASLACGLSGSVAMLIAARALQGVGAALMTPQTMAIITRVFPADKRGAAMGMWGAVAGVASIVGPLLGGVLIETVGWGWIFFVNLPVGLVGLWFGLRRLPRLATHHRGMDLLSMVLSVLGLLLFVFGIQEGETFAWGTIAGPITVWGVISAGLVVLALFVWRQTRLKADALLPLHLFSHRNFGLANVAGFAVSIAMIGVYFPLALYLQSALGLDPLHAALVTLPGSLLSMAIAPLSGRLSDNFPGKWVVAAGFSTMVVSLAWMGAWIVPGQNPWLLSLPLAFYSAGTSFVMSPLANVVTHGLQPRDAGAGAGTFNTNRQVGGVVGSAAVVAMVTARLGVEVPRAAAAIASGLPAPTRAAFEQAIAQGALSTGLGQPLTVPASIEGSLVPAVQAALNEAMHSGLAVAVSQAIFLVVGALSVGLIASLAMNRPARAAEAASRPVGVVEA